MVRKRGGAPPPRAPPPRRRCRGSGTSRGSGCQVLGRRPWLKQTMNDTESLNVADDLRSHHFAKCSDEPLVLFGSADGDANMAWQTDGTHDVAAPLKRFEDLHRGPLCVDE